jgi:septation ring formation regulator EzrA
MSENKYTEMTITEAMKRIKRNEQLIETNRKKIEEYSSLWSNEKVHFGTVENQKKEIESLVQSCTDLTSESCTLYSMIIHTNTHTMVEISVCNKTYRYTIGELLRLKRKDCTTMRSVFGSLNDNNAKRSQRNVIASSDLRIEKFYDEKFKTAGDAFWSDLYNTIDGRLETINATTKLLPLDDLGCHKPN